MLFISLSMFFACQDKDEPLTCEVDGQTYEVGEWFDASDGCNSCMCEAYEEGVEGVMISCTEMACDTGLEPGEDTGEQPDDETGTDTDSGGDTNTDTDTEDTSQPEDCSDLSVADCASNSDCTVITAVQVEYDERNECYDWDNNTQRVGCMSADMGCGAAFTYAAPSDNPEQCHGFTNTCIPEGWVGCEQTSIGECN